MSTGLLRDRHSAHLLKEDTIIHRAEMFTEELVTAEGTREASALLDHLRTTEPAGSRSPTNRRSWRTTMDRAGRSSETILTLAFGEATADRADEGTVDFH